MLGSRLMSGPNIPNAGDASPTPTRRMIRLKPFSPNTRHSWQMCFGQLLEARTQAVELHHYSERKGRASRRFTHFQSCPHFQRSQTATAMSRSRLMPGKTRTADFIGGSPLTGFASSAAAGKAALAVATAFRQSAWHRRNHRAIFERGYDSMRSIQCGL
jgi:hypothetical protein